ncbi:MAG: CRTAC1 family protein, partial [Chloroflexia bacterium]|nr:CRTAC1 family protein [Chloroflexia bacterium]
GDSFVRHELPHYTSGGAQGTYVYASNGSGLAVGDVNGDGNDDLIFGNIAGTVTLYLNDGHMHFTPIATDLQDVRALAIVDTDGDGKPEVVATQRFRRPVIGVFAHNTLTFHDMPDVYSAFYAMNWRDLNGDGKLDVVFGTYDTEQLQHQGLIFNERGGGGVFIYYRDGAGYRAERLNEHADALTIAFPDINHDGVNDIMVGNDFNRRDMIWLASPTGWQSAEPFSQTTENTMSIDVADAFNTGTEAIFATDMKPYNQDVKTMAIWLPAMKKLTRPLSADDPQYTENALQVWQNNHWQDLAYNLQIDASGWSWSGKFGDLDNDGWQDLYIVNGMIAKDLLNYLPHNQIAEPDMLFVNNAGKSFTRADWGLSNSGSGRAMSMVDLNHDGRLDVVVNPMDGHAVIYENQRCAGNSVELRLEQPHSPNPTAIGATVRISAGTQRMLRTVRAASGYLSGDSQIIHFGIGDADTVTDIEITWPDGSNSHIDSIPGNALTTVTRTE